MATITAFILIGTSNRNNHNIIPTHYITLYENDLPSLSLYKFDGNKEIIRIKPPVEKLVDNIYLLILTFILKAEINSTDNMNGKEIHKLYNDSKKYLTYDKLMESLKTYDLKVIFNILAGSTLLKHMDRIKDYPNDFEVTTPKFRKEYNNQTGKVEFLEF